MESVGGEVRKERITVENRSRKEMVLEAGRGRVMMMMETRRGNVLVMEARRGSVGSGGQERKTIDGGEQEMASFGVHRCCVAMCLKGISVDSNNSSKIFPKKILFVKKFQTIHKTKCILCVKKLK